MTWTFQSDVLTSASFSPGVTTSFTVASANGNRKMLSIFNSTDQNFYVKLGAPSASLTDFTVRMGQNMLYELPVPCWNGAVQGIWEASSSIGVVTLFEMS
jgi:hypothetical protein